MTLAAQLLLTISSKSIAQQRLSIRIKTPLSLDHTRRIVAAYVAHYNEVRLHGAIGYVTPMEKLEGRAECIRAERKRRLAAALAGRRAREESRSLAPAL